MITWYNGCLANAVWFDHVAWFLRFKQFSDEQIELLRAVVARNQLDAAAVVSDHDTVPPTKTFHWIVMYQYSPVEHYLHVNLALNNLTPPVEFEHMVERVIQARGWSERRPQIFFSPIFK